MKKARNMFVLALVLLSVISMGSVAGTYAKYTSTGAVSDTARVAKFGIDLENDTTIALNLFKDSYTNVEAKDGKNVIAPGTTNYYDFKLTTVAPEVAYTLEFAVDEENSDISALAGKIKFAVVDNTVSDPSAVDESEWVTTVSDLVSKLNADSDTIAANTVGNIDKRIIWTWDFDGDDTTDTKLGNAETLANITVALKITATQVD